MPRAGTMRELARFQRRAKDANGDLTGDFADFCARPCAIVSVSGTDAVFAQRPEGVQPVIVTLHYDSQAAQVTTADRFLDREGQAYKILAANADPKKTQITLKAWFKRGGTVG